MFGSTSFSPCVKCVSFFQMRCKSCAFALGFLFPMLFTHRIRLSLERIHMIGVLDSGSPSQSLEKTTRSRPLKAELDCVMFHLLRLAIKVQQNVDGVSGSAGAGRFGQSAFENRHQVFGVSCLEDVSSPRP